MSFLKASWRKLAIANYVIEPQVFQKYLPRKTELDFWEGKCYASLVGFMFMDTKLLGLRIPFHVNFEEVNLRFYVRHFDGTVWKRGVVFVKEIVPKAAITFVANTFYKEHYQTLPMRHRWDISGSSQQIEYQWKCSGKWQKFSIEAGIEKLDMPPGSEVEFITEHYWGYSKHTPSKTVEYEVRHPRWQHFEIKQFDIEVDFGKVYGPEFCLLNTQHPASVMLAEGSIVSVESKKYLPEG